jgi:hypothetical protein
MKALVALACKILRIAFRVLKEGIAYDREYDQRLRIKYQPGREDHPAQ